MQNSVMFPEDLRSNMESLRNPHVCEVDGGGQALSICYIGEYGGERRKIGSVKLDLPATDDESGLNCTIDFPFPDDIDEPVTVNGVYRGSGDALICPPFKGVGTFEGSPCEVVLSPSNRGGIVSLSTQIEGRNIEVDVQSS